MLMKGVKIDSEVGKTRISVNDLELTGVTKFEVEQEVGMSIPRVTLHGISSQLNLDLKEADVEFKESWISVDKLLPNEEESVLCLVKDRYGIHQEVLYRKFFEESDAVYEGTYWCSYRTMNIEAMGINKVLAWRALPSDDYSD